MLASSILRAGNPMLMQPKGRPPAHKRLIMLITMVLLTLPAGTLAGPQVIEETATITTPDPVYRFPMTTCTLCSLEPRCSVI
jgi:hypothetical protein